MAEPLRITFARWCRSTRAELDITQQQLADAVGVSRSLIAAFESDRRVPDLETVDRIAAALGVEVRLDLRRPHHVAVPRERDILHARCSGYVGRRLQGHGLEVAREVEVLDGRSRGWIDLLAFDPRTRRVLVIEVKTWVDDVGVIERQIGWYERLAPFAARARGWDPNGVVSWLLILASDEADHALARQRDAFAGMFQDRAAAMRQMLANGLAPSRGLALIDPARRRQEWLLPTRLDGRRTALAYADRAAALRALGPSPLVTMSLPVARAG